MKRKVKHLPRTCFAKTWRIRTARQQYTDTSNQGREKNPAPSPSADGPEPLRAAFFGGPCVPCGASARGPGGGPGRVGAEHLASGCPGNWWRLHYL